MFTGERMLQCPSRPVVMDRRWKSTAEIAPNCPRCASPNTKFCYYNNYSLSQPRYFCKACRRYWTKGGSLRNVPVGGGCRKNRRSTKSSTGVSPATDSVSLTFCSNNGGIGNPMVVPHPPTTASSNTTATDSDTPNIDLALMFAKFLNPNQNSCFDPGLPAELQSHDQVVEVHSSFSLMGSSSDLMSYESLIPIQFPEEQVVLQQQQQQQEQHGMHLIGSDVMLAHDQDVQFTEGCEFGFREQSCRTPQFMDSSSDPNCYDLETILSDEYGQGMALWSENIPAAAVLPNFSWQTQGLQESVVPSPADHHFPYHSNVLFNDNWSSFDLSSCGVFSSRP